MTLLLKYPNSLAQYRAIFRCISGCPACVGPIEEVGLLGKKLALELLAQLDGGAR